jgi:hypothetical protein
MNLGLLFRVLWRFRLLVAGGLVLAVALATVSVFRISLEGVEYRADEEWHSVGTLFVTQPGFPWGRSVLDEVVPLGPDGEAGYVPRYAEGARFQGLAILYAQLAKGDAVRQIMLRDGPIEGEYDAAAVRAEDGTTLPLVAIGGHAESPELAEEIGRRAVEAFLLYLRQEQERSEIPAAARIQVEVVEQPGAAVLVEGRRLTRPIFLFVLVLSATVMLAFALENFRPRSPAMGSAVVRPASLPEAERKTA